MLEEGLALPEKEPAGEHGHRHGRGRRPEAVRIAGPTTTVIARDGRRRRATDTTVLEPGIGQLVGRQEHHPGRIHAGQGTDHRLAFRLMKRVQQRLHAARTDHDIGIGDEVIAPASDVEGLIVGEGVAEVLGVAHEAHPRSLEAVEVLAPLPGRGVVTTTHLETALLAIDGELLREDVSMSP